MNEKFLLKEEIMKKNVKQELRYALPSSKILENVSFAFISIPNGENLILKDRKGLGLIDSAGVIVLDKSNISTKDFNKLQGANVEIKYSALNSRGKGALLDYLAELHREKMKSALEGNETKNSRDPFEIDFIFDKGLGSIIESNELGSFGGFPFGVLSKDNPYPKELEELISSLEDVKKTVSMNETVGLGKTAMVSSLMKDFEDVLANSFSKESGDNSDNPKSKETPDIDLDPATEKLGKSSNLDLDCNMIVEVQDGMVRVVKSRGNEGFSPEMEFVVITNLDQLEFYHKDFFKQKNILIVKWRN